MSRATPPTQRSTNQLCFAHFCDMHGPTSILCCQKTEETTPNECSTCPNCQLILSNDATTLRSKIGEDTFVSSQCAVGEDDYSKVRKACLKLLSSETTFSDTPLMFGDSSGATIGYVFKVNDNESRGGIRKYGFLCLGEEKSLMDNWIPITERFESMGGWIKTQVAKHQEMKDKSDWADSFRREAFTKPKNLVSMTKDDEFYVKVHAGLSDLLTKVA